MPKLIIANNDTDSMVADPRARTSDFMDDFAKVAGRMMWFAEPGDIVLLPHGIAPEMAAYVARMQHFEGAPVRTLVPDWKGEAPRPLGRAELLHQDLIQRLRGLVAGDWSILPYYDGAAAQALGAALGLPSSPSFRSEGGADLLNDKRIFRTLAAGRGIPLAAGRTAHGAADLTDALAALIQETGSVIVKQDRHCGGYGNLILHREARSEPNWNLGAQESFTLGQDGSLAEISAIIWERLATHAGAALVVEAYAPAAHILTSEFHCAPGAVTFLNWGEVRQAPVFSGLVIPPQVPSFTGARFISHATEIARLAADLGYVGLINIDGIADERGQIVFNEWNGRVGGCSHVHLIAATLAGDNYGDRLVAASSTIKTRLGIEETASRLDIAGLHFDRETASGAVIASAGADKLEFISLAPNRQALITLEAELTALIRASS